ncbi:hypothetical protein DXG01_009053 [Tephrocybe rancida]|nr:hypothetical protein DXG01_009053 [Tephrocybe rancida]
MSSRNGYTAMTPKFAQFPSQPTTTASSRNDLPSETPTPPDEVDDMELKMSMWRACHLKVVAIVKGNIGLLLITGAQIFHSLMNVAVKKLNAIDPPVSTFELIFFITYICSLAYMLIVKVPDPWLGPKGVRLLLAFRGFSGFFGVFGIYYSLQYLSLSDATVLTFLAPLCTGIAGSVFLGEKYTLPQALASTLPCLVSSERVVHVSHLPITFKQCTLKQFQRCIHNSDRKESASIARDDVALDTEMIVTKTPFIIPTEIQWLGMLIMIGVFGFLAQTLLTLGLQRETAGRGSIAMYTQIVFAAILERVFFKTEPSFLSIMGTLIIVSSALYIAITKQPIQKGKTNVRLTSMLEDALEEGLLDGLLEAHAEEENAKNGPDSDESSVPFPSKLKGDDHDNEDVLPASQGTTHTTNGAS